MSIVIVILASTSLDIFYSLLSNSMLFYMIDLVRVIEKVVDLSWAV